MKLDGFSAYARLRRRKIQIEQFDGESWIKNLESQCIMTPRNLCPGRIHGCV
jgi:hypothetical protein